VTITYGGGSVTSNGSGNYTFTIPYNWSGTVTPSKVGYVFTPDHRTYENVTVNQTAQDYFYTPLFLISGNAGTADAIITYDGGETVSDNDGNYAFYVMPGWSGTVTPSKVGYTFSPATTPYTNVLANMPGQNYTATLNTYTLTYSAGANGSITGASPQIVAYGENGTTVTATPNTGYHFINWSDGVLTASRTDNYVIEDLNVTANFAINTYTLTYTAGSNGTISGATPQTVNYGADGTTVTALPISGYHFVKWSDNSTANPRTDTNVTGDITVTAAFTLDNQAPTDISLTASSINENQSVGTTVGTLSTADPNAGDTFTYSLACATPGADDASFIIAGASLNTTAVFDYETKASYAICVRVTDTGGLFFDKNFTITVNNLTENGTVTIQSTGTADGWVLESGLNTNKGGTLDVKTTTLRLGDDAAKKQYRSILSFASGAAIPDNATITKVTLKLRLYKAYGGGSPVSLLGGFMADVKNGFFGKSTLELADWQSAATKSYGPFKPNPVSGWYTLDLSAGKAYINKLAANSGLTQIRLRFKTKYNNNTIANYIALFSGNAPLANRPQLIIEYTLP
jgi:hypothetical protein